MTEKHTRYLNLLNDFGFKHLFGQEANKDILIEFLNALFEKDKKIVNIEYGPTEFSGESPEDKKIVFDLFCTGDDGEEFIIEMQQGEQEYFRDRSVLYMSRRISQQLKKGMSWREPLKKVYLVAILDFKLADSDLGTYLQDIRLSNTFNGKVFYDRTVYKFLELPNFDKKKEELVTNLDKWVYLLKNMHLLDKLPEFLNEGIFQKVTNIVEMSKLTKEERFLYERAELRKSDYEGQIAFAEKKGVVKVAIKLKAMNTPIAQIAEATHLSYDEIEKL